MDRQTREIEGESIDRVSFLISYAPSAHTPTYTHPFTYFATMGPSPTHLPRSRFLVEDDFARNYSELTTSNDALAPTSVAWQCITGYTRLVGSRFAKALWSKLLRTVVADQSLDFEFGVEDIGTPSGGALTSNQVSVRHWFVILGSLALGCAFALLESL